VVALRRTGAAAARAPGAAVSTDRQVDLSQRVIGLPLRNAPGAATRSRALRAVVAYMDGSDANLVDLRLKLAAGCPRIIRGQAGRPLRRLLSRLYREMTESRLPCHGRMAALIQIKAASPRKLISFTGSKSFRAVPL
jgi:hypothetical protein